MIAREVGEHPGTMVPLLVERLTKALGPKRAEEVMHQTLATAFTGRAVDTPQDLLDFAAQLTRRGGLLQAVGRSLKVLALLRGAVEREPS